MGKRVGGKVGRDTILHPKINPTQSDIISALN